MQNERQEENSTIRIRYIYVGMVGKVVNRERFNNNNKQQQGELKRKVNFYKSKPAMRILKNNHSRHMFLNPHYCSVMSE